MKSSWGWRADALAPLHRRLDDPLVDIFCLTSLGRTPDRPLGLIEAPRAHAPILAPEISGALVGDAGGSEVPADG